MPREHGEPGGWGSVVIIALVWSALLVLHYALMLSFAGWVGTADDFMPWSCAALLLWAWTRRRMGYRWLGATLAGRAILVTWLVLLVIAAAGVDEGRVPGIPAIPAAIVYAVLPIGVVGTVIVRVVVTQVRRGSPGPAA